MQASTNHHGLPAQAPAKEGFTIAVSSSGKIFLPRTINDTGKVQRTPLLPAVI